MLIKTNADNVKLDNVRILTISGRICLIDEEDADRITCYKWHLRRVRSRYYAVRKIRSNGKEFLLPMHRQIMHCPQGSVVHHKNRWTLDNRKANLNNMTEKKHHLLHKFC